MNSMIRWIAVSLVSLLLLSGYSSVRASPQNTSPPPQRSDTILDWPDAVRKAIEASPDRKLGAFGTSQAEVLRNLNEQIKRREQASKRTPTQSGELITQANDLISELLPEHEPVVIYKLGGSPICQLATSFVSLTAALTEYAEVMAKLHAFNHGNEYSWPGFIQTIWANVSAARAEWAVEHGATAQDADEAINELNSMIWHAGEAVNFEQQSFNLTGDGSAQSTINMLQSATDLAQPVIGMLQECKSTL